MLKLNNKGFSLIEVIAVVAIIAVLGLILVPNIIDSVDNVKEKAIEDLKDSIILATEEYIKDHKYNLSRDEICVYTLVDEGYLKGNILNPSNSSQKLDTNSTCVSISFNETKNKYVPPDKEHLNLRWEDENNE